LISLVPTDADPFSDVAHLLDKLKNLSNADQANVANAINKGFGANFDAERAGDGGDWNRLRPSTLKDRAKKGFGAGPILNRTGGYRRSFTNRGDADHVEKFRSTRQGWTLESGSDDERVGILEFGGFTGNGRFVPPRPASFLSDNAEANVFDVLEAITDRIMATGT
jgi:phage gpG-like protein